MAYKDSDEIATNSNYTLGDYSFRIERSSVPGSTNDKIEAICTKDGKNARKSIQVPSSTQLLGWYVEANETEATVYVDVKIKGENPFNLPPFTFLSGFSGDFITYPSQYRIPLVDASIVAHDSETAMAASLTQANFMSAFTYNEKTVYYWDWRGLDTAATGISPPIYPQLRSYPTSYIAWTMFYGDASGQEERKESILVARFAIEIEDAGGDGPGSDWTDPGDYDPDWEEGDPTHTLYVTVTGALSGRHNDPIEDPSYSYIPSDKDTVKDYGCGGDGGHGGGGGAGASTVVIHKFATNQANSKEVTAIARRHGYGSGGGKGGKGGDGCILVYY